MALGIIKAQKYLGFFLAALEEEEVLSATITKFDGAAFKGALDDTITMKLKRIGKARDYEWRTRTAPIVIDDITQVAIDIKLDTHTYSAVSATDEELTLDVMDFVDEVIRPQRDAVTERLENKVAAALAAAPFVTTNIAISGTDDPYLVALDIRAALNSQKAPKNGRNWVVGANVERWILGSDRISKPEFSDSTSALRDAMAGRVAGLNIIGSDKLGDDEWYAYHRSALVLANVAPDVPAGVAYGAKLQSAGYGLRVIRDYDPNYLRDRSVVSTFTGISSVNDEVNGSGVLTNKNPRGVTGTFTA